MLHSKSAKIAIWFFLAGVSCEETPERFAGSGFVPFADVDELSPQSLTAFCDRSTSDAEGFQWCQHSVHKQLDDGGEVELHWKMHVKPHSILSLDTEAVHGVRLRKCGPSELELEMPESHAWRPEHGNIVVGSRFAHSCEHLEQRHLYHRVVSVHHQQQVPHAGNAGKRMVHLRLATDELPNFAHAARFIHFAFSYMPAEARDLQKFPKMRTDYGLNRDTLQENEGEEGRRLGFSDMFKKGLSKITNHDGVHQDTGGFASGGHGGGSLNTEHSILNFAPKQVSNFGWNWNFRMNTTEAPTFTYKKPGVSSIIKLRKPYIKVHAGIFLNFTSEFSGITKAPLVNWKAGLKGHGHVQGRVLAVLNTTGTNTETDAIQFANSDLLEKLETPQWFDKIDFATGAMPVSIEPGCSFHAKFYHKGVFHGALAFGGQTHGTIEPTLSYNSVKGFDTTFKGELIDTDFWPPMWMIFTRQFEFGVQMSPSILMKGDFAGLEKATMAVEFMPYMNLTVVREGEEPGGHSVAAGAKDLTVYPFRVMGIKDDEFHRKYKVKIVIKGPDIDSEIESSPEMSWGQISFHDHVSKFTVSGVTQPTVTSSQIQVVLIEVDDSSATPVDKVLGNGSVRCTSLLNGECHPMPILAHIMNSVGQEIATVEMAIIWEDNPQPWFASKIRGVAISFPQVVLRTDAIKAAFPNAVQNTGNFSHAQKPVTIHLIHGGITYTSSVSGSGTHGVLKGDSTIEFGPNFLETWTPCSATSGPTCETSSLEVFYGTTKIANGTIPQIDWTSQTAMQGTGAGLLSRSSALNVPSTVALYATGSAMSTIAVVKMNAQVVEPAESTLFLKPSGAQEVGLGGTEEFVWTVSGVDTSKMYSFTLSGLKLLGSTPTNMQSYVNDRRIGDKVLQPVAGSSTPVQTKCAQHALAGISASDAPCSFAYKFPFGTGYNVGDQVVIMVEYSVDAAGPTHQMFSHAFEIVPAAQAVQRRLGDDEPRHTRRLFSAKKWNSRVDSLKNCGKQELHFNIGAGVLFRGRVDNVGVPKGFPMLGGLDEKPKLTTGYRNIRFIKPGTDAKDYLPSALCKAGLCSGGVPNCAKFNSNKLHFPKIIFSFNRAFHYNNKGKHHGLFKTVLAYAFSTLPEMVDVMIKEQKELSEQALHPPKYVPPPSVVGTPAAQQSGAWPTGLRSQTQPTAPAPSVPHALPSWTPKPKPAAASSGSTQAGFKKWWMGGAGRRLLAENFSTDAFDGDLKDHQVALRFPDGLPYPVDHALVERMIKYGQFMPVDDDDVQEKGPLEITSFYLEYEPDRAMDDEQPVESIPQVGRGSLGMLQCLGIAAGVACAAALVMFLRRDNRNHWRDHKIEVDESSEGSGLE